MAAVAQQARRIEAGSSRMPRIDYWLVFSVLALTLLGLVMVSSASITFADREIGWA
jgi:cell division protein FtsW (lipid II flippase)